MERAVFSAGAGEGYGNGRGRDSSSVWCRSTGRGSLVQEQRRTGAEGAEAGEVAMFGPRAGEGAVFGAGAGEVAVWRRSREEQGQWLEQKQGKEQFGAGAEKNRSSVWCKSSVWCRSRGRVWNLFGAGAGQVGGDESMVPPNYDPADGLSLTCDTPTLTLSRWRLLEEMSTRSY